MIVATNGLNEYCVDTTLIDCPCLHRIMAENHDDVFEIIERLSNEIGALRRMLLREGCPDLWLKWHNEKDQLVEQYLKELFE